MEVSFANRMLLAANAMEGIVRCDMIAESLVAAAKATGGFKIPVVVRLQGTNSDKGLKLVLDLCFSPCFSPIADSGCRLKIQVWTTWLLMRILNRLLGLLLS